MNIKGTLIILLFLLSSISHASTTYIDPKQRHLSDSSTLIQNELKPKLVKSKSTNDSRVLQQNIAPRPNFIQYIRSKS